MLFCTPLVQKFLWNIAAVLGDFLQHDLVQPNIHLRGIAHLVSGAPEFGRKFLARRKAALETKELQQIHNRIFPIELLGVRGGEAFKLADDIDRRDRGLRGGGIWRGLRGGSGLCDGTLETELIEYIAEQTHGRFFLFEVMGMSCELIAYSKLAKSELDLKNVSFIPSGFFCHRPHFL